MENKSVMIPISSTKKKGERIMEPGCIVSIAEKESHQCHYFFACNIQECFTCPLVDIQIQTWNGKIIRNFSDHGINHSQRYRIIFEHELPVDEIEDYLKDFNHRYRVETMTGVVLQDFSKNINVNPKEYEILKKKTDALFQSVINHDEKNHYKQKVFVKKTVR